MNKNLKFILISILSIILYNLILILPMGTEDSSTLVDDMCNLIYLIVQIILFIYFWFSTININKNIDKVLIIANIIFVIIYLAIVFFTLNILVINCSIWIFGILSIILKHTVYNNNTLSNITKNIIQSITIIIISLLFVPFINGIIEGNTVSIILLHIIAILGSAVNINLILYEIYSKHNSINYYNTNGNSNMIITIIIIAVIVLLNGNMAIETITFNSKASQYIKSIETANNGRVLEKNMIEFSENHNKENSNSIFNYKRIISYFDEVNETNLQILEQSQGRYDQNYYTSISTVLEQFLLSSQLNSFMIIAILLLNCITIYIMNFYNKNIV